MKAENGVFLCYRPLSHPHPPALLCYPVTMDDIDIEDLLPEVVHMPVDEGVALAREMLTDFQQLTDMCYEGDYLYLFPFSEEGKEPVQGVAVVKNTKETQIIALPKKPEGR